MADVFGDEDEGDGWPGTRQQSSREGMASCRVSFRGCYIEDKNKN